MLKKLLGVFILVFGLVQLGFSVCEFDLDKDNTCERYYGGFENVFLEFSDELEVDVSSLDIYQNDIPRFEFLNDQENLNTFFLDNALTHSGVYTLVGEGRNNFNDQVAWSNEEIIIDLYQPLPPRIDLILESSVVEGVADHLGDKVFAYNANGDVLSFTDVGEDGTFSLDLGINSPSYVAFTSVSQNGLESSFVERYVYSKERGSYLYEEVSSITLDRNIINQVNNVISGKTYDRNFYVSGTALGNDGSLLFVNGQRVQLQENSFGTFIELNTGVNTIEVKSNSGLVGDTFSVEYVDSSFSFEQLSIQKVFDSSFSLDGIVTQPKPFLLFVNGEFISRVPINADNTFSFDATNVNGDKLLVELYGEDNSYESIIVYRDQESPEVISHNFENIGFADSLLFEIDDDVGIDFSSLSLNLNSNINIDYSQRFGNFVTFDISELPMGDYNFELVGSDFYSRSFTGETTGFFSVSEDLDFKVSSTSEDVKSYGSILLFGSDTISLNLETTGPIAFKHIFIDGVEHIDYSIQGGDSVVLSDVYISNSQGIILFEYVDEDGRIFNKEFSYILDNKKTDLEIDSITHYARPASDEVGSYVRVTGKIIDPHFDWNSFYINGINPLFMSNFYFEVLVKSSDLDLLLTGSDILGNGFKMSKLSSLFENDLADPSIFVEDGKNSFFGNLQRTFNGNEELISFENTKFMRTHFENQFDLPVEQREGIQHLEVTARNQFSQSKYISEFTLTGLFDETQPQVFVSEEDEFLLIDIDPTFGEIIFSELSSSGEPVSSISCESKFYMGVCLKVELGSYVLLVEDNYGNNLEMSFGPESISNNLVDFNSIYFHGTDTIVNRKEVVIQGSVVSDQVIGDIYVDGDSSCDFDGVNFVCFEEASIGENIFVIELLNSEGISFYQEGITIIRLGDNPLNLDIDFSSGVYEFGNRNYYFGETVVAKISSNQDSILSYYINGEKVIYGPISPGVTSLNLDLSTYIEGRDSTSIDVGFKAENDDVRETSIFTLFYDRTKELILEILIN